VSGGLGRPATTAARRSVSWSRANGWYLLGTSRQKPRTRQARGRLQRAWDGWRGVVAPLLPLNTVPVLSVTLRCSSGFRQTCAVASTLVAGLELARTGTLALDQDAPWTAIRVGRRHDHRDAATPSPDLPPDHGGTSIVLHAGRQHRAPAIARGEIGWGRGGGDPEASCLRTSWRRRHVRKGADHHSRSNLPRRTGNGRRPHIRFESRNAAGRRPQPAGRDRWTIPELRLALWRTLGEADEP
jgi:hypothetical protein